MIKWSMINERLQRFDGYLNKLYYAGKLKLNELQAFRKLLEEITCMFERLKALSLFGFMPDYAKKDMSLLTSELTLMEYNVSLISTSTL